MQPHDLVGGRLVAGDAKPAPDCPLVEAEGDRRGFASQIASIAVRNRLTAGGGSPLRTRLGNGNFPDSSELGSDFDGVLDDSGNVKTLFRARIRQKCTSFPLAGGPAIRR
jgi:hypothetical protein